LTGGQPFGFTGHLGCAEFRQPRDLVAREPLHRFQRLAFETCSN
jgi:hypothetical protein